MDASASGWARDLAATLLLLAVSTAGAEVCTWNLDGVGDWNAPANWDNCTSGNGSPTGTPGSADTAIISVATPNAIVNLVASRSVDRLVLQAGELRGGKQNLTILSEWLWSGPSRVSGSGLSTAVLLDSAATATFSGGTKELRARKIVNFGSITWTAGDLAIVADAEFENRGAISMPTISGTDLLRVTNDGAPLNRFHQVSGAGAIALTGPGTFVIEAGLTFDNGAEFTVDAGRMRFDADGTDFGTYRSSSGGTIEFGPPDLGFRDLTGSPALAGDGVLRTSGAGQVRISGSDSHTGPVEVLDGELDYSTGTPKAFLNLTVTHPGNLGGSDDFTISGNLFWNGGQIDTTNVGSATLAIGSSGLAIVTLNDSHPEIDLIGRRLINQGTFEINAAGNTQTRFWLQDGADIDNQGQFLVNTNSTQNLGIECRTTDCARFDNRSSGVVVLNDIGGIPGIRGNLTAFDNAGVVRLVNGCAGIDPPGVDTGIYDLGTASGCTLAFFTPPGRERVFEPSVILLEPGDARLQLEGRLRVNGTARTFQRLYIGPGATLYGPADITLASHAFWRGRIEGGAGTQFVIEPAASVSTGNDPMDSPTLAGRAVINQGQLELADPGLILDGGAHIENSGTLRFNASPTHRAELRCLMPLPGCGSLSSIAPGVIIANGNLGGPPHRIATEVAMTLDGLMAVQRGEFDLDAQLTLGSQSEVFLGNEGGEPGLLRRALEPLDFADGGRLAGHGTVVADVSLTGGMVDPTGSGSLPGRLTIQGNLSTSSTVFDMLVDGNSPATAPEGFISGFHDRLAVTASADLDGTVDVSLGGSFLLTPGDGFDLMSFGSRTGTGSLVLGSNPDPSFFLSEGPTRVRYTDTASVVCTWNPAGSGADVWSNPAKWDDCAAAVGPPAGTPGLNEVAVVGSGLVGLDFHVSVGGLILSGGEITGDHDLLVQDEFSWTGGRMSASSNAHETRLESGAVVTLAGGQKTLKDRSLVVESEATWTTGRIELADSARLQINGVFESIPELAFESIIASGSGSPEVDNHGTLRKSGPGSSGLGSVGYRGNGAIEIDGGHFRFGATGTINGSVTVAAGARVEFIDSDRTFELDSSLGGDGEIVFGLPSNQIAPEGPPPQGFGGRNVVLGSFAPTGPVILNAATLVLGVDPMGLLPPVVLPELRLRDDLSQLEGDAEIRVTGNLEWNGGVIRADDPARVFRLAAGASGTLGEVPLSAVERVLSRRHFINEGSLVWTDGRPLAINDGALFENRATWACNLSTGSFCDILGNAVDAPRLWNTASGTMTAVAMVEQFILVPFDNDGLYDLQAGRAVVIGSGEDAGSFVLAAATELYIDGPVRDMEATSSISGAGTLVVSGGAQVSTLGSVSVAAVEIGEGIVLNPAQRRYQQRPARPAGDNAVLNLQSGAPVTIPRLRLFNFGTLVSPFEVNVSSTWTWKGGTLDVGSVPAQREGAGVPFRLQSGAAATIGAPSALLSLGGYVRIEGSATWTGGTMRVDADAQIDVPIGGALTLVNSPNLRCGDPQSPCSELIVGVGGLLRRQGSGSSVIELTEPMRVDGTLAVEGGQLSILDFPLRARTSGVIRVAPGASLAVPEGLFLDGGFLTGGGQVNANVTNIAGTVAPGSLFVPLGPEGTMLPQVLSINGGYEQHSGATLEINIGGFVAGSSADRLAVTGSAELGGTLVLVNDGFVPTPPDRYDFLTAVSGVSFTFDTEVQPFAGYRVDYGATEVTLGPVTVPFVVNSVADPGTGTCDLTECTLREAINAANATSGADTIEFNIPPAQCTGPGGACTIAPASPLPTIDDSLEIKGYTQPGAIASTTGPGTGQGSNAVLKIEIDGNLLSGSACLEIESGDVRISGIATFGCAAGLVTSGTNDDAYQIVGNFLGLRADGGVAPAGQAVGVSVRGGNTTIGDGTPSGVNVIAGNLQHGIKVESVAENGGVTIVGNLIGTAADGSTARSNGSAGIRIATDGRLAVEIGGGVPGLRNVIAGNGQDGIRFECLTVDFDCFDGSRVLGNAIGVGADGSSPLGNGRHGILVAAMANGRLTIGGEMPGEPNVIAHNDGDGVRATHGGLGRLTVSVNEIFANAGIGFDLGGDGRTANDPGDADTGPNGLQNFPLVTAYALAPTGDAATFTVEIDTPELSGNYPMVVDFYKADSGEPAVWLGATTCASANAACVVGLTFPPSVVLQPTDVVVVIATDGDGNSSEASFYTTSTLVEAGPDVPLGAQYEVFVEVTSDQPFVPAGVVEVSDDVGGSCVAPLVRSGPNTAEGSCLLTATSPAGLRSITGTFRPGDQPFVASEGSDTLTILSTVATTTSIVSVLPGVSVVGQPYRVDVAVSDGMAAVGVGVVEVRQLSDGQTCTFDLASATGCSLVGNSAVVTAVQARYLGAGAFEPSSSGLVAHTTERADTTIAIIEDDPDPSLPGQAITVRFTLAVLAPGSGVPGGEVLITDGSASCGVTLPATSCTFVPKATGSVTIEARYLGDANYNPSTATTPHQIIASGADLGITKRNGLRILPGGQPSEYVILVTNAGPEDVTAARVVDLLPPELTAASWSCTATGAASCPASGTGNIDALVNLPVGGSVTFVLTVTAQLDPETVVTNTATVATPNGVADPIPSNNSSSDTDPIGLFGDGFETESE
jgi:CSLREA domain-containing protein/uncharacterized repeat protein (TIGR01451 family)